MSKQTYYHVKSGTHAGRSWRKIIQILSAFVLFVGGGYLLFLLQSPNLFVEADEQKIANQEQVLIDENKNFIKIDRINVIVPIDDTSDASALEQGAWHRFPERGDPIKGGNFILSAHRFRMGITPSSTVINSPFYHLDKVETDDIISIFYDGQWYNYVVADKYDVEPDAVEIEEPTSEPRLTLYTCTLGGAADGRVVIEGQPMFDADTAQEGTRAPVLGI